MASLLAYAVMALSGLGGAASLILSMSDNGGYPCPKCKKTMMPDWNQCLFCQAIPEFELGKPAILHFVTGPNAGKALILEKPVTSLGSAPGNDVVLGEAGVSRRHAGIRRLPPDPGCAGGGYELADLGSTNGVSINGEKKPKKVLAVGDIIRIGSTEMIFRV